MRKVTSQEMSDFLLEMKRLDKPTKVSVEKQQMVERVKRTARRKRAHLKHR